MFIYLYFLVFAGLFGLIVGSFLNVVIYRIPAELSIVRPGSRCPGCETPIAWYDNVPVLSYLILRGRCRHCKAHISPRYAFVELLTCAVALAVFWQVVPMTDLHHLAPGPFGDIEVIGVPAPVTGLSLALWLFHFTFFAALIAVFFIDLDHFIVPNEITLAFIPIGVIGTAAFWYLGADVPRPLQSLGGVVAGGGILWAMAIIGRVVFGKPAMGMGDVKLLAMIGAFVGAWPGLLIVVMLSATAGSILGILARFLGRAHEGVPGDPADESVEGADEGDGEAVDSQEDGEQGPRLGYYIPFGPYLVTATFVTYLVGDILIAWYRSTVLL